jgi:hypothetical protein
MGTQRSSVSRYLTLGGFFVKNLDVETPYIYTPRGVCGLNLAYCGHLMQISTAIDGTWPGARRPTDSHGGRGHESG